MQTTAMIRNHPAPTGLDRELLARAVDAAAACAQACTACADACLSEEMVADLRRCIRTDLDPDSGVVEVPDLGDAYLGALAWAHAATRAVGLDQER